MIVLVCPECGSKDIDYTDITCLEYECIQCGKNLVKMKQIQLVILKEWIVKSIPMYYFKQSQIMNIMRSKEVREIESNY